MDKNGTGHCRNQTLTTACNDVNPSGGAKERQTDRQTERDRQTDRGRGRDRSRGERESCFPDGRVKTD